MCMVKRKKDKYKSIAIYVDDLLIASEEPQKVIQDLKEQFILKINGDDHWNTILVVTTN